MMIRGERKTTGLKEGMDSFLQSAGNEVIKENNLLHQTWEMVASEKVLEHTDSIRYSKKKKNGIIVFLDDPIWVAECDMSRDSYRLLLGQMMNKEVEEIHFYLTKDQSFKTMFIKRDITGKVLVSPSEESDQKPHYLGNGVVEELSPTEMKKIKRRCGFIEDETLRESVSKAMKSNLEWKKGQETAKRR